MSLLDIILGRTKPKSPGMDKLFAISTAQVTLQANLGFSPGKKAAICFRPVTSSHFESIEQEVNGLLQITEKTAGTKVTMIRDTYGFQWAVLEDNEFENLVAAIHMVSQSLQDGGFGTQLLAAIFQFEGDDQKIFWIYNFKRSVFYPFVPVAGPEKRDNATEFRLRSVMEQELPIEPDIGRWYPMWNLPL